MWVFLCERAGFLSRDPKPKAKWFLHTYMYIHAMRLLAAKKRLPMTSGHPVNTAWEADIYHISILTPYLFNVLTSVDMGLHCR